MTKRFVLAYDDDWWAVRDGGITLWKEEVVDLLNRQYEYNEQLYKEFMDFKIKLIKILQEHFKYACEQREKNLCNPFVAEAYNIIKHDIVDMADNLGVDFEKM